MSRLSVFSADYPDHLFTRTENGEEIARILASQGVRFERWEAGHTLAHEATSEEILSAYAEAVARLKQECGFVTVDVVHMKADNPQKKAFREKFLEEHTHSEDEVRFFVEGQGMFYLHLDKKIYMVLCCKGDLISVPAGTRHWFDMGDQPEFTAIRFFNNPEGWVANFTGEPIARNFPRMPFRNRVILLDIEGTTGSISFVRDTLFPYARKNLADYLVANRDSDKVAGILSAVSLLTVEDPGDLPALVTVLQDWMDADLKVTPLKELQGLIWEDGYRNGHFTAHVYGDAEIAMKRWHQAGYLLYVYSSGSVKAQNLFYQYSDFGDLRPLFKGYFDTNSGPKKEADSYLTIARAIGRAPGEILFLSDDVQELDAARQAGMSTGWLVRGIPLPQQFDHDCFSDFSQIELL